MMKSYRASFEGQWKTSLESETTIRAIRRRENWQSRANPILHSLALAAR